MHTAAVTFMVNVNDTEMISLKHPRLSGVLNGLIPRSKLSVKVEPVPVSPGASLTHQASTCCFPLPEDGAVLAELLFQHAVVPKVLLPASPREGLHKLFLTQNQEVHGKLANRGKVQEAHFQFLVFFFYDQIYLEADFALAPLSLPFMQTNHESLVAFLPVQSHGLMALAEDFNFILLHVRNDLKREKEENNISIRSHTTNILKLYGQTD